MKTTKEVVCSTVMLLMSIHPTAADPGIVSTVVVGNSVPHIGKVESCVHDSTGADGPFSSARINYPWGVSYDATNNTIFVADCGCPDTWSSNDRIRRIDLNNHVVRSLAGSLQGYADGVGQEAHFRHLAGLEVVNGDVLYMTDSGNNVIRKMSLNTNHVTTWAGNANAPGGHVDGGINISRFSNPQRVLHVPELNLLFVADTDNHSVRSITLGENPNVKTVTGGMDKIGFADGEVSVAKWKHPTGIAYDARHHHLYVSDHYNHAVRRIDLLDGHVITVVGNGVAGGIDSRTPAGGFFANYPEGLVLDAAHERLYVAEFGNHVIRAVSLADHSLVSVLAGSGSPGTRDAIGRDAEFYHPTAITFDPERHVIYVADQYNHRVRAVTTLDSDVAANRHVMLARHLLKWDAYRDVYIHRVARLKVAVAVASCLFLLLVLYVTRRRWLSRLKRKNSGYRHIA